MSLVPRSESVKESNNKTQYRSLVIFSYTKFNNKTQAGFYGFHKTQQKFSTNFTSFSHFLKAVSMVCIVIHV